MASFKKCVANNDRDNVNFKTNLSQNLKINLVDLRKFAQEHIHCIQEYNELVLLTSEF